MKKQLLSLFILGLAATSTLAAPQNDEISNLLQDNSVVGQFKQAGLNLRNAATDLVDTAKGFLGVPYRYGGTSAETGFDCSGFVVATMQKALGQVLPRRAADQAAATQVISKEELRPGDLVFFNTMKRAFSHVGIYVGEGKFIHSPRTGSSVRIDSMDGSYWVNRFNGARRVLRSQPAEQTALSAQVSNL